MWKNEGSEKKTVKNFEQYIDYEFINIFYSGAELFQVKNRVMLRDFYVR